MTQAASGLFSFVTLLGDIALLVFVCSLFVFGWGERNIFLKIVGRNGLLAAFLVALGATLGSLFLSTIVGYAPCDLCWSQRIFMYPQVILLGMAFLRKETSIAWYGIVLSTIGAVIALYHYLLQMGVVTTGSCGTLGASVSCSARYIMNFGYITIPAMSLTAFLLIALSLTCLLRYNALQRKGRIVV